jgi:hypothetical protein
MLAVKTHVPSTIARWTAFRTHLCQSVSLGVAFYGRIPRESTRRCSAKPENRSDSLLNVCSSSCADSVGRALLSKRAARLRALNQITQSITQHCGLPPALTLDYDSLVSPPHSPSENALLDAADLSR